MDLRSIGVANASIIVDRSAPVPGNVYDGETAGQDLMYTKDQDKVIKKSHWILFKNFMHTVKVKDLFDLYVFLSISLTSRLTFELCQPYTTWRIHCLLTKVKGIYYLSCSFFYRDIFHIFICCIFSMFRFVQTGKDSVMQSQALLSTLWMYGHQTVEWLPKLWMILSFPEPQVLLVST